LVAKEWGIDLERWYEIGNEERAEMIAVYELKNMMAAYDQEEAERKSKQRQRSRR
jgi:hypothetical protein